VIPVYFVLGERLISWLQRLRPRDPADDGSPPTSTNGDGQPADASAGVSTAAHQ
jgi:hypothetical protein